MIIYMATNLVNGKQYVGQTVGCLEKRKQEHVWASLNKKDNSYFHNAIYKYGIENFKWLILANCNTIEHLNKLEIYYIKFYNSFASGYNLVAGGKGSLGYKCSEELRKKRSESQMGKKNHNYGKKASKETKQKMSEAHLGSKNYGYGKTLSEEHKAKIAKSLKGRFKGKNNPAAKAVIIHDRYFNTVREAAEFLNVVHGTIYYRIKKNVEGYSYV